MKPIPKTSHRALIDLINETYTDKVERILSAGVDDRDNIICLAQDGSKQLAIEITDIDIKIKLYNPTAKFSQEPDTPEAYTSSNDDRIATNLQHIGDPIFGGWLGQIKQMLETSDDLESMRESLFDLYPDLDGTELTEQMTDAMAAASMAGFWDAGSEGDEAEFARIPEGTIRRRNGVNYVMKGSRWHNAEVQSATEKKIPTHARNSAIHELVDDFEIALKKVDSDIQASRDIDEIKSLQHPDTTTAIGDKLIRELMQLNSRDDAEEWAAKIDLVGISSRLEQQTVRAAADFYQLIGKDLGVKIIRHEADRSYANDIDRSIGLEDDTPRSRKKTLFHELGHHTEFQDADSLKVASDWIAERATGQPESLRKMTGIDYDEDELAVPDNFFSEYVGKQYSDGFTEVHSMGLEMFSSGRDVVKLFEKDREHFDLIIRYIRQ